MPCTAWKSIVSVPKVKKVALGWRNWFFSGFRFEEVGERRPEDGQALVVAHLLGARRRRAGERPHASQRRRLWPGECAAPFARMHISQIIHDPCHRIEQLGPLGIEIIALNRMTRSCILAFSKLRASSQLPSTHNWLMLNHFNICVCTICITILSSRSPIETVSALDVQRQSLK